MNNKGLSWMKYVGINIIIALSVLTFSIYVNRFSHKGPDYSNANPAYNTNYQEVKRPVPALSEMSYSYAKNNFVGRTFKLAFVDTESNSDNQIGYYIVGYYSGNKTKVIRINPRNMDFSEVIDYKLENKPYVILPSDNHRGNKIFIHIPPEKVYKK